MVTGFRRLALAQGLLDQQATPRVAEAAPRTGFAEAPPPAAAAPADGDNRLRPFPPDTWAVNGY